MPDAQSMTGPEIHFLGDTAISVEFGKRIALDLIRQVHAFDAALNARCLPGVIETVPSYRAVTMHIDPLVADIQKLQETIRELASIATAPEAAGALWDVPVVYGGEFGCDLEHVAAQAGLSPQSCIEQHAAAEYLVAMVGFLPGFSYLSGLSPNLHTPRRDEPRRKIPASSISIGGQQTAIGSLEGPSGWHLIGRTPVRPYHPGRHKRFLFGPGDRIRFLPIAESEWSELDRQAEQGAPLARRLPE